MSGYLVLDWLTLTVSLYNTLVLLWLGMIVLLTAERRHLGIWLAGGGLLTGAAFFLSHSAILGFGFLNHPAIDFWWRMGWILVILSPFAWYVVMLWYAGYWEASFGPYEALAANRVRRRHRPWLWLLGLVTAAFFALFVFAHPLPSFHQVLQYDLSASPSVNGVPALILLYPVFIVTCIVMSLDALLHPGPTVRMMGTAARRRARPWLAAASGALLLVSLLVAGILWTAAGLGPGRIRLLSTTGVVLADVVIELLIAIAITLTGQAIVAYEIFTGKSLPRGGLQRAWRRTLVLALGLGTAAGLSIVLGLPAIYTLLVSIALSGAFYALLVWRSYHEREMVMSQLRPFVGGLSSYRRLAYVEPAVPGTGADSPMQRSPGSEPFTALCSQVLGASWGLLAAHGPVAELFGPPWMYPPGARLSVEHLNKAGNLPWHELCIPLEEHENGEAAWAVPLWNDHGRCGVLLLGSKAGGGVYTQEEIETARVVCERLVDAQAGETAARRLLDLQRRQLAEGQALDRRARRVLHDDILPQLHATLLAISRAAAAGPDPSQDPVYHEAAALLSGAHRDISNLLHSSPAALTPETAQRRLVEALHQVVEQELQGAFDQVSWQIEARAEDEAARLPPLSAEALFYAAREAIRNVARHARPPEGEELRLQIAIAWADGIEVCIQDNGVGMGASKKETGGSGQGMILHATLLALAGGSLQVEAAQEAATRVRLWLPPAAEDRPNRE